LKTICNIGLHIVSRSILILAILEFWMNANMSTAVTGIWIPAPAK